MNMVLSFLRERTPDTGMPEQLLATLHPLHRQLDLFLKGKGRDHPEATALLGRFLKAKLPFQHPVDLMPSEEYQTRLDKARQLRNYMRRFKEDPEWEFTNFQLASIITMPLRTLDGFFLCTEPNFDRVERYLIELPWAIRQCETLLFWHQGFSC